MRHTPRGQTFSVVRHAAVAVLMAFVAACGTDTHIGEPSAGPCAHSTPQTDPSRVSALPLDLRAAYIASIQREAPESYAPITTDNVVRLDNNAQRFVATVDRKGVLVSPDEGAWHLRMHTAALGCEGALLPVTDVDPAVFDRRIEFRREILDEWYINGPLGVEQGFVLKKPPACAGPKTIHLAIDGDVTATLDDADGDLRGDVVRFVDADGQSRVSYSDLFVTDATGKTVPSWFSVQAGQLSLVVDDATAVYPLAIDPLIWVQQQKLLASDGISSDTFGYAVSLYGETALIGAYQDDDKGSSSGSAYVFVRANGTTWTQQAKLVPSDGDTADFFGFAVSLYGDTAVVGAFQDDTNGGNAGSAYVFVRNGTTWSEQAKLIPSDGGANDHFGRTLSLFGDTALVAAAYNDDKGVNSGSAYVFVRSGTTWTEQAKLLASDGAAGDVFGQAVSLSGDTALVGAVADDDKGTDSGSAYVFVRNGTTWTEQAKLLTSDGGLGDAFGNDVSLSGDSALVAAFTDDAKGMDSGSAYVFVRNGTTWTEQAKLVASDGAAGDQFGNSVTIFKNTAVIGAWFHDDNATNAGAGYVFARNGTTWTEQAKLLASDGASNDRFGSGVSLYEDTVVVGALYDDDKGVDSGSAYVFVFRNATGDACVAAADCASGFCADGVCCNTACGGGDSSDCQACSVNAGAAVDGTCGVLAAGTECRAMAGACDVAESCNGAVNGCPVDAKMAAGTVCRAAAGVCDAVESCDGTKNDCPADASVPDGTSCPDGACTKGVCSTGMGGAAGTGGAGGTGGVGGVGGVGGTGGVGGVGETGGAAGGGDRPPETDAGCGCRLGGDDDTRSPWFAGLALGLLVMARRRRLPRGSVADL